MGGVFRFAGGGLERAEQVEQVERLAGGEVSQSSWEGVWDR